MDEILRAYKIVKNYENGSQNVNILNSIDFAVKHNSLTAIIGKSGSGKTTLLKILSGLERPDEGEVYLEEVNIHFLSNDEKAELRRQKIGFVFQDFSLIPELTVLENMKLPCYFDRGNPSEEYLGNLIDILQLQNHLYKYPQQLSGGEKQRTAIARALINKPAIVFADEPTGNLDNLTSRDVLNLFLVSRKLLSQTVVMVTPDLEIAQYADEVYLLTDGKLQLQRGTHL